MDKTLTEQQVRAIIRDEMAINFRSGSPSVPPHTHDGNNNLNVSQSDIIPSTRVGGRIQFSRVAKYTLNIKANANPTLLLCYGIVVDNESSPTIRVQTFGTAELGQSYYYQPLTESAVTPGGPVQPFIQHSTYVSVQASGANGVFHALADEGNLVDVEYPVGTIHARLKLISVDNTTMTLEVTHLDSGWTIITNIIVI